MTELFEKFSGYGGVGLLCVLAILAAVKVYRDWQADRKAWQAEREKLEKEMAELRVEHAAQMNTFMDRHISKADTWVGQYHEFAKRSTDLVEALTKKKERT